jgi:CRISPR/Cas system-associated exonuclease Cas4 (RecB family)
VDRIDQYIDGSLAIIDYKTGSADLVPERLSKLENMELSHETINDNIKSFQLPLYYHFISKHFPTANINAELYSLRMLERKVFISETDYPKRDRVMEICLKALEFIFSEIINPQVPFRPDKNERKCEYCSFTSLCR